MKFTIVIHAPPSSGDPAVTAFRFAESVLAAGHQIYRLFFFNDGVLNGLAASGDPAALCRQWEGLISRHTLDAVLCVTSAKKRGLFLQENAESGQQRHPLPLAGGFTIGGLALLLDGAVNADRLITFGC